MNVTCLLQTENKHSSSCVKTPGSDIEMPTRSMTGGIVSCDSKLGPGDRKMASAQPRLTRVKEADNPCDKEVTIREKVYLYLKSIRVAFDNCLV